MIKTLFALFTLTLQHLASNYDCTIINIEAKLFPKIALLEKRIEDDKSEFLNIAILSSDIDAYFANKFKNSINAHYPDAISNKKIIVTTAIFDNNLKEKPDAVIVLYHSPQELRQIASWANKNKILSFAYDRDYLEYGLLASIFIGKSIKPYLNGATIKKYGFVFDSYLLQLSKFTQQENSQ